MPVTVRRASEADAEGLSRLAALTFPLACTPQTPADLLATHIATRLDPASFRGHLADPACTLLLAEDAPGGDPVGYTMLLLGEPPDPDVAAAIRHRPTVELVRFYVHPDHHGSGTAGLLMEHTLAAAGATEARGAWLGVSEENARANAFYARHGFEPVGRKRFHIGDTWEDDVVRERVLRTPWRGTATLAVHRSIPVQPFGGQRRDTRLPSLPDPALGASGRPSGESRRPGSSARGRPRPRSG